MTTTSATAIAYVGARGDAAPDLRSAVADAGFFESIGYSTVWEDERVLTEGLRPAPGERVLSITSGGCLCLHFLLFDVAEVICLDFNPAQTALLELKVAWARVLSHDELWEALGLAPSRRRHELFLRVRQHLRPDVRRYWDLHPSAIETGVTLAGRQDEYLHLVGRLLHLLQGGLRVDRLLRCGSAGEQRRFYEQTWNRFLWRRLCDVVFSRWVLDRAFDERHFAYARQTSPALAFRNAAEATLRDVPVVDNFYLYYLLRRSYPSRELCPAWLRRSSFGPLRSRLDRLSPVTGELEQQLFRLADDSIDCFNFSNVFDWMSEANFLRLMKEVVRVARPGARLCYWTNLVNTKRSLPTDACPELVEDEALGRRLMARNRTPGYSSCVVAQVFKSRTSSSREAPGSSALSPSGSA